MFKFVRSLFSNDLLIELSENKVSIQSFDSNKVFDYESVMAIESTKKGEVIKATGLDAKKLNGSKYKLVYPFKHSRSFVSSFLLAEKLLQHGLFMFHKSKLRPSPRVIIHQLEKTEGGLTDIEQRVLRELALGAGAREVLLNTGTRINVKIESYDSIKARLTN